MTIWKHQLVQWTWEGPREDDWPQADAYRTEWDRAMPATGIRVPVMTEELVQLRSAYWQWRGDLEQRLLTDYGDAGYELVAFQRDHDGQYHAAFKRDKETGAQSPQPTRPIGFRPRGE